MDLVQILANTDWCSGDIAPLQTLTSTLIFLLMVIIPVALIAFGMLDLGKAVMASKEDDIKKSQQLFIKRLISAGLVFFVVVIVKTLLNVIAPNDKKTIWNCACKFINGPESNCDEKTSKQ